MPTEANIGKKKNSRFEKSESDKNAGFSVGESDFFCDLVKSAVLSFVGNCV
jgi:hypothetical protein